MSFATAPRRGDRPALIGMVHLRPLPGSPYWDGNMEAVLDDAKRDAERLVAGGCDAVIVENMADLPYLRAQVPPETVASMALATAAVVAFGVPTGVQVLAAANRQALGVAVAAGAHFVRAEAFAYAHVADEGWLDACAGPLLRARAALSAEVAIWADVRKKHAAHAVTADISLADLAKGHAFSGADVLIVTGTETGARADAQDVDRAATSGLPIAVGSGVTEENVRDFLAADALIVGSWIKEGGDWRAPVDLQRVRRLTERLS